MDDTQSYPIHKKDPFISKIALIFALLPVIDIIVVFNLIWDPFSIVGPFSLSMIVTSIVFFSPIILEIIALIIAYMSYKINKDDLSILVIAFSIFILFGWSFFLYGIYRSAN